MAPAERSVAYFCDRNAVYRRRYLQHGRLYRLAAEIPPQRYKQLQGIGKYRSLPARLCGRILPHTAAERSFIGGDAVGGQITGAQHTGQPVQLGHIRPLCAQQLRTGGTDPDNDTGVLFLQAFKKQRPMADTRRDK